MHHARPLSGHDLCDLQRHPASYLITLEDRVDGFHIGDCVRPGCGYFSVLQDSFAVDLSLPGVLVGGLQDDLLDFDALLVPQFARAVGWGVEGDLDLQPAPAANDVDALVWFYLRRDGELSSAASEVQDGGGHAVDLHNGVIFNDADQPFGFLTKYEARRRDGIAADIHHSAAAIGFDVADVGGVVVVEREEGLDGAQVPNLAIQHHLLCQLPLGMKAVHESFH